MNSMNDFSIFLSTRDEDINQCSVFEGASTVNLVFLLLITLGIFISYLPQYHRIYSKKTSEGLSVNFLLLGSCSSIFTLTNIILVSGRARDCCRTRAINTFNCINSQLNLLQIGVQCTCAIFILIFVLVLTKNSIKQDKTEYAEIIKVGHFVLIHGLASVIQIIIALSTNHKVLIFIANINGLLSTLLTVIKYVPQIFTTYKLKHPGTLSIGMMCIQTPGGFIFTATLFFTKGSHWSSWISYLFAALLQGTLLSLCIYYEYFRNEGINASLNEQREIGRIVDENIGAERSDDLERDASRENTPLLT